MNIENEILHLFIKKYSEIITNSLCGEKYQHNKSEIEYERAGTCERKITTILGETKKLTNFETQLIISLTCFKL
jgi:hypothetical protein